MLDDFLIKPLLAGCGVALVAGPLGTFVVWRRMAYFGEALSHTALLGVALGLLIGISTHFTVILISVVMALLVGFLQHQRRLASDTLLGIFSHSALSLGLVALTLLEAVRIDLLSYLFGDILAVSSTDLYWIFIGGLLVLSTLALIWQPLLSLSVHEELAQVEGVPITVIQLVFMLMIAIVIAVAMKIVGILLITSLLIIPAASARRLSKTPEQMALFSALFGVAAVLAGLLGSLQWDTPTGPSIVVAASLLFLLSNLSVRNN